MNLFCTLAIYLISNLNSWMMSSLFFSFAISMKASAIFYMPAFLGIVQYRYGIVRLILCFVIMVSL